MYYRFDPRHLDLIAWARWISRGKPLHFSVYGDSLAGREVFIPRSKHDHRSHVALWDTDEETEVSARVARLMHIDSRLYGALSASERRLLYASVVPAGRPCPAAERAAAAGVSVETLRGIRRRAMALIG